MTDDTPDPRLASPVDNADRLAAIARLREVFANGELTFDRFSTALEQTLAATSHADLELAMTALPLPIRLTPASRRLRQPLVVEARLSNLELGSGWQLGAETSISVSTGAVCLDLTAASWDTRDVELRLDVLTGSIDVIVPRGVAVQIVSAKGQIALDSLEPPIPGAPLLRVSARVRTGSISFAHSRPSHPAPRRRWRLGRREQPPLPPP